MKPPSFVESLARARQIKIERDQLLAQLKPARLAISWAIRDNEEHPDGPFLSDEFWAAARASSLVPESKGDLIHVGSEILELSDVKILHIHSSQGWRH